MNGFATPRLLVLGLITVLALALPSSRAWASPARFSPLCLCQLCTTTVLFETMWLSILWVLWLITAAVASSTRVSFMKPLGSRGCSQLEGELFSLCVELPAIEGLAYATWILMMSYCLALYTLSYRAIIGGHPNIWSASASQLPYSKRYYVDLTSDGTMESDKPAV
ncbi:hypothetical protein AB1N83_008048 [Pleurotus pulmonarius]